VEPGERLTVTVMREGQVHELTMVPKGSSDEDAAPRRVVSLAQE